MPILIPLVLAAAQARAELEPELWPLHPQAQDRVREALERDFTQPERFAWFLAEQAGEAVGVIKASLYPAPPVYQSLLAGLTGDDFSATVPEALPPLLSAAEAFLEAEQAAVFAAACPARETDKLQLLEERGYVPLTLWMIQSVDTSAHLPSTVRPATEADLPALVRLNRDAQEGKHQANSRFWTPHPDAPARFEGWMRHALTLPDRDLLVNDAGESISGFIIAQPTGLPPAHDPVHVGTLDDLHTDDWGTLPTLLQAAHQAFDRRGKQTIQAICPAAWTERADALQASGFRTANLWLLRDTDPAFTVR
jgi:hypothetical protein